MKIKIVAIIGPTAVGKSDFAVNYALKNNGEIISADSRQVYKGLNIGTGKITKLEMKGVPHYLLDIAEANEIFNVDKFKKLAENAINEIAGKRKLPIICGGTGFYIDALINDIEYPNIQHNEILRESLKDKNSEELFNILKGLDNEYASKLNNSEKNNEQRLIRSIEIAEKLGNIPKINKDANKYDVKWIGLNMPFDKLKLRIHNRLINRINNGMIEEIIELHKNGLNFERMEELGLEYRYISRYLNNKITKEEMIEQLESEICKYAKRQLVWFKRNKNIEWITL